MSFQTYFAVGVNLDVHLTPPLSCLHPLVILDETKFQAIGFSLFFLVPFLIRSTTGEVISGK